MNWCAPSVIDNGLSSLSSSITSIKLVDAFSLQADTYNPQVGDLIATLTVSAPALGWKTNQYGYRSRTLTWPAGSANAVKTVDSNDCYFVGYAGSTPLFAVEAYAIDAAIGESVYFVPIEYRIKRDKFIAQSVCDGGFTSLQSNASKVKLFDDLDVNVETDAITAGTLLAEIALQPGTVGFNPPDYAKKRDRWLKFPPILADAVAVGGGSSNHVAITNAGGDILVACPSSSMAVETIGDKVFFVGLKIVSDQLD